MLNHSDAVKSSNIEVKPALKIFNLSVGLSVQTIRHHMYIQLNQTLKTVNISISLGLVNLWDDKLLSSKNSPSLVKTNLRLGNVTSPFCAQCWISSVDVKHF